MAPQNGLKYDIILETMDQKPILNDEIMPFIIENIRERLTKFNVSGIGVGAGTGQNRVYVSFVTRPTQSASLIIQTIKQHSSYHAWREFGPILRKFYWYQDHFWE